jgi:hypothetical protein
MQPASYSLKTMVVIRMFAEITALAILASLPLVLWFSGQLAKISPITQALLVVAGIVAALILPAYGFVTLRVVVDVDGLRTISLFRKQHLPWGNMLALRLRSAFGWRRYVVVSEHEELSFPIWLNNVEQLVDQIRSRLPQGGRMIAVAGAKVFAEDNLGTAFQMFKLASGLLFIGLLWTFFFHLQTHHTPGATKPADPTDAIVILVACLIFTVAILIRSAIIVMMPRVVSTDQQGVTVQSWFRRAQFAWDELRTVQSPLFFLPEGLVVKTAKGNFLFGNQLDAFDELEEEMRSRLIKKG